ncbi:MAG: ATP-binding cassette domain-containing protein [Chloroflexi bacterium]|nr:ATP-binding cassette domain-containing protein [Chloroflexota bacterium]
MRTGVHIAILSLRMTELTGKAMAEVAVSVERASKRFGDVLAVDSLSFEVAKGELFGLLGPNGAGKTTTIRMILDLLSPTSGRIAVLGGPMDEAKKRRIGYLPEERGLYGDMRLGEQLVFLGQLKGMSKADARRRTEAVLLSLDLWGAREKRVDALSRGMRQKAQFAGAVLHEPELMIVDEPFSGLDPLNSRTIKAMLLELQERGTAIIMSLHQMSQVEEMCERILLIDRGRSVVYGALAEIRSSFDSHAVRVWAKGSLEGISGVEEAVPENGALRLRLKDAVRPEQVIAEIAAKEGVEIQRVERAQPSLEEIFVRLVGHPIAEGE